MMPKVPTLSAFVTMQPRDSSPLFRMVLYSVGPVPGPYPVYPIVSKVSK